MFVVFALLCFDSVLVPYLVDDGISCTEVQYIITLPQKFWHTPTRCGVNFLHTDSHKHGSSCFETVIIPHKCSMLGHLYNLKIIMLHIFVVYCHQLGLVVALVAHWYRSAKLLYAGPISTGVGDHLWAGKPPQFVTSYSGQLSLLPSADGEWVTAKVRWRSAAGEWPVKLCDSSLTRAIPERFRDLMIKRYTNVQLLYFTLPHISYIPLSRMHAQFLFNQPCFLDLVEAVLADRKNN